MNNFISDKQEINGNERCPCGSTQKYRNCCKRKDLIWYKENGKYHRFIPIEKEVMEELIESKTMFKSMYGREVGEDDYVFFGIYDDKSNFNKTMVRILRTANVAEEYIYAYCQTGIILTEENMSEVTDVDIEEFSQYVQEYRENVYDTPLTDKVNILMFVNFANQVIKETYDRLTSYLNQSYNYFIKVHLEEKKDFLKYDVTSILDFCGLCAIKTIKNLDSIAKLNENELEENIYATSRSIFESYLYMVMINKDESFFRDCILSSKRLSIRKLAKESIHKQDIEVYDSFFDESSRYVHLNIETAQSYFRVSHPFEEIDTSLVASVIGITFAVLTLEQIAVFQGCNEQFRNDILYLVKEAKQELIKCYHIKRSDISTRDKVYSAMIQRLS